MNADKVELLKNEKILFVRENVVLTSQRVLANWHKKGGESPANVAFIKDVATVRKLTGGKDRSIKSGLQLLVAGAVLVAMEIAFTYADVLPAGGVADVILFLAGAVTFLTAVYILIGALLGPKPHTTLLFVFFKSRDIGVSFPGYANPDAEELARLFERAKSRV